MSDSELIAEPRKGGPSAAWVQLLLGLLFGLLFGFLLQKGGAAKYHILIGVLLLQDWTVVKIMLSAIVVGMVGIYTMKALGLVELHLKPTRYLSNALGGVVFGIGFALAAYCPGTSAAALGQGNYDAIAVMIGMVAGSWLFAETSDWTHKHLDPIGERGKVTFPQLWNVSSRWFVPAAVIVLITFLVLLNWLPTM